MGRKSQAQIDAEASARQKEIDDAVANKVRALMPELAAQLAEQLGAARQVAGTSGTADSDRSLINELVVGIAKMSDPNNKKRIVSPEVMAAREAARERMTTLLIEAHAQKKMPVYSLINKVYLKEIKIEPQYHDGKRMVDQQINWPGVPNEAMVPVNDVAKAIHKEFLLSIGEAKLKAPVVAPWVLSRGEIKRGHADHVGDLGNMESADPRMGGNGAPVQRAPDQVRILGTVAKPADVGFGERFQS